MASRRRPRTRVYDCNFNIGESYYKPVMDRLDRKYSGKVDPVVPSAEREATPSDRAYRLLDDLNHEGSPRPSARANRLMADFETNGVDHKPSRASFLKDDDDAAIDAEFEATMKRIKAARATRNAELDDVLENFSSSKKKANLADQILDCVGLDNKTQRSIEDSVLMKHKSSSKKYYDTDNDDKLLAKWTAVRPGANALMEAEEAASESSTVARARKSRARIQDIDTELEELAAKGAARQKRINDLRALVSDNSDSSSNLQSDSSVKSTVTKRISVKSTTEKKQVSF